MIIKSLGHEHLSKFAFLSCTLFDLSSFVLEPDFDLILI